MSSIESDDISGAAGQVMAALQPLTIEQRARVIQSMAALYGIASAARTAHAQGGSASSPSTLADAPASGQKPMSLVEFIKDRQPATNVQRIACFAYYREKYEGTEHFASLDLAAYFGKAKLKAPGPNYARDYTKAVKDAWIHDDGPKSYLTQAGERAVEAGFGGKAKERGPSVSKKKKKAPNQ